MPPPTILTDATVLPSQYQRPGPCALVIFGASGDLTRRKLFPALYALASDNLLPESFAVVGFARREKTDEAFREEMRAGVDQYSRLRPVDAAVWERLAQVTSYVSSSFEDPSGYERLKSVLGELDARHGTGGNRVFYLATPPDAYVEIVERLGAAGLVSDRWDGNSEEGAGERASGWTRVIIEKPFGRDLASARNLNADIHRVFREPQVFRIDHYMGKETVQN
ncbi:MAG TPA: hypothetical protein VMC09_17590, partial [Anaerolineales bacterium]|nr:hypothetical protein [Anaerolineales bacterium]